VGFFLDSETKVDAVHGRMVADGIDVEAPQRTHAYSFYIKAPGGFLVEVGA
jgi:lactoylglutathione lyase